MNRKSSLASRPAKKPAPQSRPTLPPFDKYYYYSESVQSPGEDMQFAEQVYRELSKRPPKVMREDFCGTFANCCAWVSRGTDMVAHGVDLDPEPLAWGKKHRLAHLSDDQKSRVHLHQRDVLGPKLPKADIITSMNFSYFIFKDRPTLKRYFKNCLDTLNKNGVLLIDLFGGSRCYETNEEEIEYDSPSKFSYFWDQTSIDPLTHHALFHIHFKREGEAKREKQFTYDWRLWTPPELMDLLTEVGFKKSHFYWEGVTEDGGGDGNFQIVETGEDCPSWIAYIAAEKGAR